MVMKGSVKEFSSLDSPLATGHYFAGTKSNFPFLSW